MKCPGQDTQYWTAGAIFDAPCPKCDVVVEFFKDDTTRRCPGCGHRFVNPRMDFGCAAYCAYAEQCLGDLPAELVAQKQDLFKDRVALAVKRYLKSDFKRIGRAARRARHTEQMAGVNQGQTAALLIAAFLWDLFDPGADRPTGAVRALLDGLKAPAPLVETVCGILEGRTADRSDQSDETRVAADAAAIALLEEELKEIRPEGEEAMRQRIADVCRTRAGQQLALRVLLADKGPGGAPR